MPTVNKIQVMDQNEGSGQQESCGYHTFKNALLTLLFQQGNIAENEYRRLLIDKPLFEAMFLETKKIVQGQGRDIDLSLPRFVELLENAKKGTYDFTAQGLSRATMQKLNLSKINAVNFMSYPGAGSPGLFGGEDGLATACILAQFARNRGPTVQVFAVGINNAHWVTALAKKSTTGEYSWDFMDSWKNQDLYNSSIANKLEAVLKKNPVELQTYLLEAYETANDPINHIYNHFFDTATGLPKPGIKFDLFDDGLRLLNIKQYFIEDIPRKELYSNYIQNRFAFMEKVEWLHSKDPNVQAKIKQLYTLTNYMLENTNQTDPLIGKLAPIRERLKAAMPKTPTAAEEFYSNYIQSRFAYMEKVGCLSSKDSDTQADIKQLYSLTNHILENMNPTDPLRGKLTSICDRLKAAMPEAAVVDKATPTLPIKVQKADPIQLKQQETALHVLREDKPKPTEGFVNKPVTLVKEVSGGIKKFFGPVLREVGIKS